MGESQPCTAVGVTVEQRLYGSGWVAVQASHVASRFFAGLQMATMLLVFLPGDLTHLRQQVHLTLRAEEDLILPVRARAPWNADH